MLMHERGRGTRAALQIKIFSQKSFHTSLACERGIQWLPFLKSKTKFRRETKGGVDNDKEKDDMAHGFACMRRCSLDSDAALLGAGDNHLYSGESHAQGAWILRRQRTAE